MKRSRWKAFSGFVMAVAAVALLCGSVRAEPSQNYGGAPPPLGQPAGQAAGQSGTPNYAQPPRPGAINYLEGRAMIGTQGLTPNSVGSAILEAGQTLSTQSGRAEILLTPGVFLRMARNSAVQMISPELANTVVLLQRGRALVEVDGIFPENNIVINENGISTRLEKTGLYEFDADHAAVRVFDGKATVQANGRTVEVKGDHQVMANGSEQIKARKFDKSEYQDDFYRWASLRSSYLTEANVDAARRYAGGNGWAPSAWDGEGWYWDPSFDAYTFIPGDGIFYSPFGFGFYSPWYAYGAPFLGFGFYGGYHHFGPGYRPPYAAGGFGGGGGGHAHSFNGGTGFQGRGFGSAGGMRGGFGGGGFHGGGGGFHGGGGGHR